MLTHVKRLNGGLAHIVALEKYAILTNRFFTFLR